MSDEPEIGSEEPVAEYFSDDTKLGSIFLACDLVNSGTGGDIYRGFRDAHFYVIIDTRNVGSRFAALLTGMKRSLVALRFASRDDREAWLTQVMQGAKTASLAGNVLLSGSGSGNSGAPLQPALYTPANLKKRFNA